MLKPSTRKLISQAKTRAKILSHPNTKETRKGMAYQLKYWRKKQGKGR
jgi:hypothetical protein